MTLTPIAWCSVGLAILCFVVIAADEVRRPQRMAIMNIVWPVTALYLSVFALWAYFRIGRAQPREAHADKHGMQHENMHRQGDNQPKVPSATQVALGTSHCGAGCTIADLLTEFSVAASGIVLFGSMLFTGYLLDLLVAWAFGIVFQYFAIRPMRPNASHGTVLWAAVKADTLSILAFQIGMYLWMALVYYRLFPAPHHLNAFDPRYWLMMQIAMVCGFATSYPMNGWLIGKGLKEAM